jgi:hypothetical protein
VHRTVLRGLLAISPYGEVVVEEGGGMRSGIEAGPGPGIAIIVIVRHTAISQNAEAEA